jgi:hypothetical protein
LDLLSQKRPREEQSDSSGKKHRPDASIQVESSTLSSALDITNTNSDSSSPIAPQSIARTSSSATSPAQVTSTNRTIANRTKGREPSHRDKEALRKELGLNYSPWDDNITDDQRATVTLALWKRELRRRGRYVPDHSPEKLAYYQIEHERNIRFCMLGYEHFRKLTRNRGYSAWVAEEHDEYERLQTRNHVPREIGEYKDIINDPGTAAFVRCIPLDFYYYEIASDTEGFKSHSQLRKIVQRKGKTSHHHRLVQALRVREAHHALSHHLKVRSWNQTQIITHYAPGLGKRSTRRSLGHTSQSFSLSEK